MTTLEQVKAWNWLMAEIAKVPDYKVRLAMKEDFKRKAQADWGWVPGETSATMSSSQPELDEWESQFLEDIRDTVDFGVDVRKETRKQEHTEALLNMRDYIRNGGTLLGIPEDIRTKDIEALYYQCLQDFGDELMQQVENIGEKHE